MKSTGIVRKLDELGRITLPIELRRKMGIEDRAEVEIYTDGDMIVLARYEDCCYFCGRTEKDSPLRVWEGKFVCQCCVEGLSHGKD